MGDPARPAHGATSAKASPASGRGNAVATSCSIGAASRPAADSTPGWRGISTLPMPSSAASAVAWIGPAPPSATSVKRRGSRPRRIDTSRMPSTICAFTTRWMPSAASSTDRPSGCAMRRSIAARAQRRIERDGAAGEIRRIEPAEHHRCIGHRRFLAAAPVARGPWLGTRGMRADAQTARAIEPCDGTAAGADRIHIDHRHAHRKSGNVALRADHRFAAFDQRDVARCAADIDGDQVAIAGRTPDDGAADHTGGGAGEEQPHRPFARDRSARQVRRATA